jgi:hypothetical protein
MNWCHVECERVARKINQALSAAADELEDVDPEMASVLREGGNEIWRAGDESAARRLDA